MREVFGVVSVSVPGPCTRCGHDRPLELQLLEVHEERENAMASARQAASCQPGQNISVLSWSPRDGLGREGQFGVKVGEFQSAVPGSAADRERQCMLLMDYWLKTQPGVDAAHAANAKQDDKVVSLVEAERPF